jgi:hypothetical protein
VRAVLTLERYAALRAEILAGARPDELLGREGVAREAWDAAQAAWLGEMAAEAERGRSELAGRYHAALAARRPGALGLPETAGEVAPRSAPEVVERSLALLLSVAVSRQDEPSLRDLAGTSLALQISVPALPFLAGAASSGSASTPAAQPTAPKAPPAFGGTSLALDLPATARLPFAAPPAPPPPGPPPPPEPPRATPSFLAAPAAPPRPIPVMHAPAALTRTSLAHVVSKGPVVPFAPPAPAAPPHPPGPPRPVLAPQPAALTGTSLAHVVPKGPVVPFAPPAPPPQPAPAPAVPLERYAAVCAEISRRPAQAAEIRARYGLGDIETWRAVDAAWQARFAVNPAAAARWQELVAHYRATLAG